MGDTEQDALVPGCSSSSSGSWGAPNPAVLLALGWGWGHWQSEIKAVHRCVVCGCAVCVYNRGHGGASRSRGVSEREDRHAKGGRAPALFSPKKDATLSDLLCWVCPGVPHFQLKGSLAFGVGGSNPTLPSQTREGEGIFQYLRELERESGGEAGELPSGRRAAPGEWGQGHSRPDVLGREVLGKGLQGGNALPLGT